MQMDCKPELRWYKCRACHRKLTEDHFSAERLATWRPKNYSQILCLQCTPASETRWWQKRADKQKYTCSACTKQRPRTAYSAEGFADQKAIVCMDCNRTAIVRRKNLDARTFDCRGPCRRRKLGHEEFASTMLLKKEVKQWLCSACQYPHCDICAVVSDETVAFGAKEQKEMQGFVEYCSEFESFWASFDLWLLQ